MQNQERPYSERLFHIHLGNGKSKYVGSRVALLNNGMEIVYKQWTHPAPNIS